LQYLHCGSAWGKAEEGAFLMKRSIVRGFGLLPAILLAGLCSPLALAASQEEAQTHYDEGRYGEAADMGASLQTADGYTLAAKSLIGKTSLTLRKDRSMDEVNQAVTYAEQAIEIDPENLSAHLQFATGLGMRGRMISKVRAQLESLPERAHEHLEIGIELAPDHAWANAFLAAWHLEIVRNGGATLGKAIYGAEVEIGLAMYDRALTLQPMSPVLPYEYAQFILALNYWEFHEKAEGLLEMAGDIPAKNHQERAVHDRIADLREGLEAEDPKLVLRLISKHLGTKKIKVPKKPR
jgi:tetratricopeptide (TPR) repeat protein